jgi:hypothetical protein
MRQARIIRASALGLLLALVLSGCGLLPPSQDAVNTSVAQTQAALPTATLTVPPPTITPEPSPTPVPPTATPIPPVEELWARNFLGTFDSDGVSIEVVRILVGSKASMADVEWEALNDRIEGWSEIEVVGEIVFRVTNNTDRAVRVPVRQATLQIGTQQIALADFFGTGFGDDFSGEIPPGEVRVGGQWFGIRNLAPAEVLQISYRSPAVVDSQTSEIVGPAGTIAMDVAFHVWEDFPPEIEAYLE